MILDVVGPEFRMYFEPSIEVPNLDNERFYELLKATIKPLWEGCVHSKLPLIVRILSIKSKEDQSKNSFD